MAAVSIAFEAPDNYRGSSPSQNSPIDLVHLAHQTSGNKDLELEVLHTFARQARSCMSELASGEQQRIGQMAHRLRGAALAIGAFQVSDAAERVESQPGQAGHIARLGQAVIEAENFHPQTVALTRCGVGAAVDALCILLEKACEQRSAQRLRSFPTSSGYPCQN